MDRFTRQKIGQTSERKEHNVNIYEHYVDIFEDLREITNGKPVKAKAEKLYDEYMSLDEESKKEFNILIDSQLKPLAFFAKYLLNK